MADVEVRQTMPRSGGETGGPGWVLAVVAVVLVLMIGWFLYSNQAGREDDTTDFQIEVPEVEAPSIDIPDEIDVNVRTEGGAAEQGDR